MKKPKDIFSLAKELMHRVNLLPQGFDNEAWRREFLVNPILTNSAAFGFPSNTIAAEIEFPISSLEKKQIESYANAGSRGCRPDYFIIPETDDMTPLIVEVKKKQGRVQSLLGHKGQTVVEQLATGAEWAILTDGEIWTFLRMGEVILHCENLTALAQSIDLARELVRTSGDELFAKKFVLRLPSHSSFGPTSDDRLEFFTRLFPKLDDSNLRVLAPASGQYNSFAVAAGDRLRWWEPSPSGYWPTAGKSEFSANSIMETFESLGFEQTSHEGYEVGFTRIVLFGKDSQVPIHMSYQLGSGIWGSKLGSLEEVAHSLLGLCGNEYGEPIWYLKKRTDR